MFRIFIIFFSGWVWFLKCNKKIEINDLGKQECIRLKMELQEVYKSKIETNEYVQSCTSNKKRDFHSISYLIDRDMSQSDSIKLGNGNESVLRDLILLDPRWENIKPKNKKGQKERDHLFKKDDGLEKLIVYAEIKSNLNLDTEKCKSTSHKCLAIWEELRAEFPDYTIKMFLVGARYYETTDISKTIMDKYTVIQENVVGIKDYLTEMNASVSFDSEGAYKSFLNYMADRMFEDK